jgi:hypothetical protein
MNGVRVETVKLYHFERIPGAKQDGRIRQVDPQLAGKFSSG